MEKDNLKYKKINLFGSKSRGTFDDFFDTEKYKTIQQAYNENDYVTCDFVSDPEGILHIEAKHTHNLEDKKYCRLQIQRPIFGLDALDDAKGVEMAVILLDKYKKPL